jgi:predicted dehydrogenase
MGLTSDNGNGRMRGMRPRERPGEDRRVVRVGLAGLGYWGPNHLRVLADFPDVEVRTICDLDGDRLERFARRHPAAATTHFFDDLLEDPEIDAVLIATPISTHFELASRALRAGKHVFVEKPLASSSEDATELVNLAGENERILMCGHTFIYSPAVRAVKGLLSRGELGDLYFISSSRVNLGQHRRDVSVLWDLAPHDFSILLHWLDGEMPETISAMGRDAVVSGIPDVAFIDLTYASDLIAHVELSWLAPSKLRRTALVGSKKMVVYDDVSSAEPVRIFDHGVVYEDPETFGQYHLSYRTGDVLSPKLDTTEPLVLQFDDFMKSIRTGGHPVADMELARKVVSMVEAAEESLEIGGAPVVLSDVAWQT